MNIDARTVQRQLPNLLLALLVGPVVLFAACSLLPGAAAFIVTSGSMAPAITAGSVVYVGETGAYTPGDVITYERDGLRVTHRITGHADEGFRTKGDANEQADPVVVQREQIIGEVVFSVPLYGHLLASARTPVGYVLLILLPAALLVGGELRKLLAKPRGEE